MAFPPNILPSRRILSENIFSKGLSAQQFRQLLWELRQMENRELFSDFSSGRCPGPVFDAVSFTASLWEAVQEVVPFSPKSLHLICTQQPLPLSGREGFAAVLLNLICSGLVCTGHQKELELSIFRYHQYAVFLLRSSGPGLFQSPVLRSFSSDLVLAQRFAELQAGIFLSENRGPLGSSSLLALPLCGDTPSFPSPDAHTLLSNRLGPVFVHLSPICILPDSW